MDVFKTLILDTPTLEGATGTVTSVDLTAGTGISVSGGPITSSGSITVTNTAPDQTVALTGGTGISTSGTYPNFTITNDAPDQTVSIASGSGISATGTYPNFTVSNTEPDQTVVLTAGTGISTSGTYPNFTVTNSAPDQTVSIASGTGINVTGTYPNFTVTNSSPSSGGDVVGPASSTDNGIVRFDGTTGKLVQNSSSVVIDDSGNVGIGTTSPNVSGLQISRNTGSSTVTPVELRLETTTSASNWDSAQDWGRISFYSQDGSTGGAKIHGAITMSTNSSLGGLSNMKFKMGTSAPSLDTRMELSPYGALALYTLAGYETVFNESGVDADFRIESNNNTHMLFVDGGNDRVGIGTTLPLARLDVESGTGSVGFNYGTLSSPDRGNLWYDTDGTGWRFNIGKVQSGSFTSQITIQDSGNIGIGTTSPSAKLDVVGSAAVTGILTTGGQIQARSTGDLDTTGTAYVSLQDNSTGSWVERGWLGFGAGDGNLAIANSVSGKSVILGAGGTYNVAAISSTGLEVNGSIRTQNYSGSANLGLLLFGNTSNNYIYFNGTNAYHRVGGNDTLVVSSTGLAVTGALSSSGVITSTVTSGSILNSQSATTGSNYIRIQNTGGTYYCGVDDSAGSALSGVSYAWVNYAPSGREIINSINGTNVTRTSSTGLAVTGAITATGNITAYYSDDRLKTKLGNIENALDKVSKLNGFYYEANETAQALGYKPVREVGLSAQQVEAVLPEVVAPAPIDNEYKTLHYERVIPLLVEAIKELKAEIELLKK